MITADFGCGAECEIRGSGSAPNPDGKRHWRTAGGKAPSIVVGRLGGNTYRFNPTGVVGEISYLRFDPSPTTGTARVARGYLKFNAFPSTDTDLLRIITAAGLDPKLRFRVATQDIIAMVDTTTTGATAHPVELGVWHEINIAADVSGASSTMKLKVDATDRGTASAVQAASTITQLRVGAQCSGSTELTADVLWDDLISGIVSAEYPYGPGQIVGLLPNRDRTHTFNAAGDFKYNNSTNVLVGATDIWSFINHKLGAISDFISASAAAAGEAIRVGIQPLIGASIVNHAEVVMAFHSVGGNANKVSAKLFDTLAATSDQFITDLDVSQTGLVQNTKPYATRPGGSALSVPGINSWEIEWTSSYTAPDVFDIPFLDGIVVEVDYLPSGGTPPPTPNPARYRFTPRTAPHRASSW